MLKRVLPSFFLILLIVASLTVWVLHRNRSWSTQGQRTLVLIHPATNAVETPLSLAIWRPEQREVLLLPLPPSLRFQSSHNGEVYALNTLPRLAEVEQWPESRWWREVSLQFGLVIDGVVQVTFSSEELSFVSLERDSWQAIWQDRSTLQHWDRLTWWQGLRQADPRKVQVLSFESNWLGEENQLSHAHFDRFARLTLQDGQIRRSLISVQVVNASGVSGQANRQARMLEIMGFGVKSVETADISQNETSGLRLQSAQDTEKLSAESVWARKRLQQLYADWPQSEFQDLEFKERVQGAISIGRE